MKKIASNIFAAGLAAIAFTACNDAKNDVIENMVYISEATAEPMSEIVLGKTGEKTTTKISVRMAQKAAADTKVSLNLDAPTLESYNSRNETEFAIIPSEYIQFPTEVVIPAGKSTAEVDVTVTSFDGEKGVDYAAPLKITSAQGVDVAGASGAFIYTFGKPLTQYAPGFAYDNAMKMDFGKEIEFTNLTLE